MNIIEDIFLVFKTLVLILGFFPSAFNCFFYIHWLLTIVVFGLFLYVIFKNFQTKSYKYAILTVIFSVASFISFQSSPGTSDAFEGLADVVNSILLSSLFALLEIIAFIMTFISNATDAKVKKIPVNTQEDNNLSKVDSYIECPNCNTWVKQNDQFCNKCGSKLH